MSNPTFIDDCVMYKPSARPEVKRASVFLAGSIEMGRAIDWQKDLTLALSYLPVTIFNPRRDDWDTTWEQDISNPQFKEQVDWEMDNLETADVIAMFFQEGTTSPISLLELGLHAKDQKLVVCCPKGFERRGNVQVVCERSGIPLVETMEKLAELVKKRLENIIKEREGQQNITSTWKRLTQHLLRLWDCMVLALHI